MSFTNIQRLVLEKHLYELIVVQFTISVLEIKHLQSQKLIIKVDRALSLLYLPRP